MKLKAEKLLSKKSVYINGLLYHSYRFGWNPFRGKSNWNVLICRTMGHEKNKIQKHEWCQRCGLCNEEIYHLQNKVEDQIKELGL